MKKQLVKAASIVAMCSIIAGPLRVKADSDVYTSSGNVGGTYVSAYVGYNGYVAYGGYNANDYVDAVINGWAYTTGNHFWGSFSERSSAQASVTCSQEVVTAIALVDITSSDGSERTFQLSTDYAH